MFPRPDLSCLYMPFLSCFLHGLYNRTRRFADTVYLFIILRTALSIAICLLCGRSFELGKSWKRQSHRKQRSNRGWVMGSMGRSRLCHWPRLVGLPSWNLASRAREAVHLLCPVHLLCHAILPQTS